MKSLKQRLLSYVDDRGTKITFIAKQSQVDVQALYRLRSGAQETLGESDAIKLHTYLTSEGY